MTRIAQRNAAVPAVARPGARGVESLGGFVVVVDRATPVDQLRIDPVNSGPQAVGIVTVHPDTWKWAKREPAVMGEFVHEKAEAVRLMQVRCLDVSRHAPAVVKPRKPVLQPPSGIKALCLDLQRLVADLSVVDPSDAQQVADLAQRYGRARDAIRELRAAFTEAEGSFETAQALLLAKMMGDDE